MRRLCAVILAATLPLLGAACGGDDDEERLTTEEFEAQANEICREGSEDVERLFEERFGETEEEPPAEEAEAFIDDELAPRIQEQIDDLRDLSPPEDIEEEYEELLDEAEQALEEIGDLSAEELFSGEDPFEDVNRRAEELGLTACAE